MVGDEQLVGMLQKYLKGSDEELKDFYAFFLEWIHAHTKEMVDVGFKNGYKCGLENCVTTIRKMEKDGITSLAEIVSIIENFIEKEEKDS